MNNEILIAKLAAYTDGFIKAAMDFGFTEGEAIDMFKLAQNPGGPPVDAVTDTAKRLWATLYGGLGGASLGGLIGAGYAAAKEKEEEDILRAALLGALIGGTGGAGLAGTGLLNFMAPGAKVKAEAAAKK